MSDVTKAELWDVRDTLAKQINMGFDRITARLDALNGRVGKGEIERAQHELRLIGVESDMKGLERRFFQRRRTDPAPTAKEGDGRRVTQRDVRLILAGVTGTIAVLAFFYRVLPLLLHAGGPRP